MFQHTKSVILLALAALIIAGCATPVPEAIRQAPPDAPTLTDVQRNAGAYRGRKVRWGGTIISTQNRANESWLEILWRPLASNGQPNLHGASEGRFLVRAAGFLDPAIYGVDRETTVAGTIESSEVREIGGYQYSYAVVAGESVYLWPKRQERTYDRYYDPWWPGPWHPWGHPYPYYYPYPYGPPPWRY
jgi:outer membrane lipoprotein